VSITTYANNKLMREKVKRIWGRIPVNQKPVKI
jgi:hypothetical protein